MKHKTRYVNLTEDTTLCIRVHDRLAVVVEVVKTDGPYSPLEVTQYYDAVEKEHYDSRD